MTADFFEGIIIEMRKTKLRNKYDKNLPEVLKQRREELGLSLQEVADICDISVSHLGMIETGRRTPSISLLHKLSMVLDVPFLFLLSVFSEDIEKESDNEKLKESIAKIRLRNLFMFDFPTIPEISLSEMVDIIMKKYPERAEILIENAYRANPDWKILSKKEAIMEYFKNVPSVGESLDRNMLDDYFSIKEELTPGEMLKRIKDTFAFKWEELGNILGKTPRSLQRYLAGSIAVPEKTGEKIKELYLRLFRNVGPLIKSYSQNQQFRNIRDHQLANNLKDAIIKNNPDMEKFRSLPVSRFLFEFSKKQNPLTKIKTSAGWPGLSPREKRFQGGKIFLQKKFERKNNPENKFSSKKPVFRKKRENSSKVEKETSEGEKEDSDSSSSNEAKERKRSKFFENLGKLKEGLLGKEVKMRLYKPKGRTYWYVDIYIEGKRRRLSTGTRSLKEANRMVSKLLKEVKEKKVQHTLYQAIDKFIQEYSKIRKISWARDVISAKNIKRFIKDLPIQEVNSYLINNWQLMRMQSFLKNGKQVSPRTVNIERAFLHKLFNIAKRVWGWVNNNPVSCVEPLPYNPPEQKVYTPDEIKRIENACINLNIDWFWDFLKVLLLTGFRKGEAINIKVKEVVFENNNMYIRLKREKSHLNQYYPVIFPGAREIFLKRIQNKKAEEYVFTTPDGMQLRDKVIRYWWSRVCKIAGVQGKIHSFRHTFATELKRAGVNSDSIRILLGQKTIEVTQNYIHLSPQDYVRIFEKEKEKIGTLLAHPEFEGEKKNATIFM